jgi:hypothetical protein
MGQPYFGLKDVKVALWATGNVYGTEQDLLGARMYGYTEEVVSAMHDGDDARIAIHTKPIGGSIEFEFLFDDASVFAILTGRSVESSGSDTLVKMDKGNFPYFGIGGIIDAAEGADKSLEIFLPKVKLTSGFPFTANFGQYITQRVTAQVAWSGSTYEFGLLIQRASIQAAVAIPPVFS